MINHNDGEFITLQVISFAYSIIFGNMSLGKAFHIQSQSSRKCQGTHYVSQSKQTLYIPQEDLLKCEDLTRLSYLHDDTGKGNLIIFVLFI